MKKLLDTLFKQRIFFVFLLVSVVLWYISRLSHDYTTQLHINVELTTDAKSDYWIENPNLSINVTAQADGRILAIYQSGWKSELMIESSQLTFLPTDKPYIFTINASSLARAIAKRDPRLSILNIEDTTLTIRLSKLATKRVPVKNRVNVHCRRQYMVVGGVELSLDSVDVKAPQIILDTLQFIPTETLLFDGVSANVEGKVQLLFADNVFCSKSSVDFLAEVAGFTEMQFELPISVNNSISHKSVLLVPASTIIKVQVPLDKYSLDIVPVASVDLLNTPKSNTLIPVTIDSLPRWAEIVYMKPKFVEFLFTNND